jgi:hypothetical protein
VPNEKIKIFGIKKSRQVRYFEQIDLVKLDR